LSYVLPTDCETIIQVALVFPPSLSLFYYGLKMGSLRGKIAFSMHPPKKRVPLALILLEIVALIAFIIVVVRMFMGE